MQDNFACFFPILHPSAVGMGMGIRHSQVLPFPLSPVWVHGQGTIYGKYKKNISIQNISTKYLRTKDLLNKTPP
jgi:hypothetical protein